MLFGLNNFGFFLIFCLWFISCFGNQKDLPNYRGYETPTYSILMEEDSVQVRDYPPSLVAEIQVSGEQGQALSKGFRELFRYIDGGNSLGTSVAMTSPVTSESSSTSIAMTSPVTQEKEGSQYSVRFYLPSKYSLDTAPKPNNPEIQIKMLPKRRIVALQFSGFYTDSKFETNSQKLLEFLKSKNLIQISSVNRSYYDDPFTFPWNRRNEVYAAVQELVPASKSPKSK